MPDKTIFILYGDLVHTFLCAKNKNVFISINWGADKIKIMDDAFCVFLPAI